MHEEGQVPHGESRYDTPSVAGSNMPMSPQSAYTPLSDPNLVKPNSVYAVPRSETMLPAVPVASPILKSSHSVNPLADEG